MQRSVSGVLTVLALAAAALSACDDDAGDATTTTILATTTSAPATDDSTATGGTGAVGATESDYLAALQRSLSTGDGMTITTEQAECVAPRWLDTIGVERLEEHNIAPADIGDDVNDDGSSLVDLGLSPEQGSVLYDAFSACDVDVHQLFVDLTADGQPSEVASCVEDALTPNLLRQVTIASIVEGQPDEQLQDDLDAALAPCEQLVSAATTTTS